MFAHNNTETYITTQIPYRPNCVLRRISPFSIIKNMASFTIAFTPVAGRVFAATATKNAGGSGEEKGLWDFILGGLQKEDQLLETDPILKKVEEKNGSGTTGNNPKNSVAVPQKKKSGGFGGLFAKN